MHAERFDGLLTFAGCDKSLPGMLMAAARINLPSVFLYGGSILPTAGRPCLDVVSVFEAVGAHAVDALTDEELSLIEHNACPPRLVRRHVHRQHHGSVARHWACPCRERLGSRCRPPADDFAYESGRAVIRLLEQGIPRHIMTKTPSRTPSP